MFQDLHLTPQRQATIYACGLFTIMGLGTLSLIALVFVALWACLQFVTLLLDSLIECLTTASSLFDKSPDIVKLTILVSIGFVLYRAVQQSWSRGR